MAPRLEKQRKPFATEGDRSHVGRTAELRRVSYVCVIIVHRYTPRKWLFSGNFFGWHDTCLAVRNRFKKRGDGKGIKNESRA